MGNLEDERILVLQWNLSTAATLGSGLTDHCREVAIDGILSCLISL